MRGLSKEQQAELESLRTKGGLLTPGEVVEFAANKKTALHNRFTWDDSEAAHLYRLAEARNVMRVHVYVPKGSTTPIRAFVSLYEDRHAEGGYRAVADVLRRPQLRQTMLDEALAELKVFQDKYGQLKELAGVFDAVRIAAKTRQGTNGAAKSKRRRKSA